MAASIHTAFAGIRLGAPSQRIQRRFISNGTDCKIAMKSKNAYQVEVCAMSTHFVEAADMWIRYDLVLAEHSPVNVLVHLRCVMLSVLQGCLLGGMLAVELIVALCCHALRLSRV